MSKLDWITYIQEDPLFDKEHFLNAIHYTVMLNINHLDNHLEINQVKSFLKIQDKLNGEFILLKFAVSFDYFNLIFKIPFKEMFR